MPAIQEVGIAGYGCYGRPIALNLRSAGIEVVVGESDDERAFEAMRDGFPNFSPAEIFARSKLVIVDCEVLADFASHVLSSERAVQAGSILVVSKGGPGNPPIQQPLGKEVAWLRTDLRGEEMRAAFLDGEQTRMECMDFENASGDLRDTIRALAEALRSTLRRPEMETS